jgi:hypothetical protein
MGHNAPALRQKTVLACYGQGLSVDLVFLDKAPDRPAILIRQLCRLCNISAAIKKQLLYVGSFESSNRVLALGVKARESLWGSRFR